MEKKDIQSQDRNLAIIK